MNCTAHLYFKQGRQCTHNVALRRVRATTAAVRICSLSYPASNA